MILKSIQDFADYKKLGPSEKVLADRNLLLVDTESFGINSQSKLLVNHQFKDETTPIVIISIVPIATTIPDGIPVYSDDFLEWVGNNKRELNPLPNQEFIWTHERKYLQHGVLYPHIVGNKDNKKSYHSYHYLQDDGYLEFGFSDEVTYIFQQGKPVFLLKDTVVRLLMMLEFANKYYQKYTNLKDYNIIISMRNVKDFAIGGFSGGPDASHKWTEPYDFLHGRASTNHFESNVQFTYILKDQQNDLENAARHLAEDISHFFGEQIAKCYDHEGNFVSEGIRL